jgi:hypothetical protein
MLMTTDRRTRIWLARHRVDFRKGHSGLLAEAYKMALDPHKGDIVIFIGRNRRRLKVLYADSTGLWISSKLFTLEAMKTKLKFLVEPSCSSISQAELALLIEGAAYTIENQVAKYTKSVDTGNEVPRLSPPPSM